MIQARYSLEREREKEIGGGGKIDNVTWWFG